MIPFLSISVSLSGEIYRWTDEKGVVHFTDDASKIPEPYSGRVGRIEIPEEMAEEKERPFKPDESSERVKRYLEEIGRRIEMKKKVETKLFGLEEELRVSEERLKRIEEYEKENYLLYQPFKDPRTGRWVLVASPYLEEKRRLKDKIEFIKEEMRSLHEELSEIKRRL